MTTQHNDRAHSPAGRAAAAPANAFLAFLALAPLAELSALLKDSRLDEEALLVLLARPDLPNTFLDEIAKRRDWLRSYAVKRAIVFHRELLLARPCRVCCAIFT